MDRTAANSPYRYWAFISYSRHDARVARLLLDALAKEVVPPARRGLVQGSSARFEPVFLDSGEAAAAPRLDEALQAALRDSARLIVLCSPFAVQSKYVEDEIRFFQESGRSDDILCLIVAGVPDAATNGDEALECFPRPLREPSPTGARRSPPLAAMLGMESPGEWRHAIDQLTAGLLGLPLAHRREWLSARRARRIWTVVAGAAAFAAVAYGVGWAVWFPQQVYAKDGLRRWGAWQPVDRIGSDAAARRPQTLRFTRRGAFGAWTEVRWVDAEGQCAADGPQSLVGDAFRFVCTRSRSCGVRVVAPDGKATSEEVFDQYGQTIETLTYNVPGRAILGEASIGCSRRPGDIDFVGLDRQPDGPLVGVDRELRFFGGGEDKSPHPNSSYAFGMRVEYDARGHVAQVSFLNADGQPSMNAFGYAGIRYSYNDAGDVMVQTTVGPNGQPVAARDGYAIVEREVDKWGRLTLQRFLDADRVPIANSYGVFQERVEWDSHGRIAQVAFLGPDRKPITKGNGVASVRHEYSEGGARDRESYFDAHQRPTWNGETGCASVETTEHPGQAWKEQHCFGPDGRPSIGAFGWYRSRTTFDAGGEELSQEYFGVDGRPVMCSSGEQGACPLHRFENVFDERGNRISSRFRGFDGELMIAGTGAAGVDLLYNGRNRVRRWIHIGLDGKPGRDANGHYAEERLYDSYGRLAEIRNVDASGRPLSATAVYGVHYEYDGYGNVRETRSIARNGAAVAANGVIAITRSRFDSRGHQIEWRAYDAHDQAAPNADGWYGAATEWDAWGRAIRWTRMGPDGRPEPDDEGVLSRFATLDERGHRIKLQLLGAGGVPVARRDGISSWVYQVDVGGHRLLERPLGLLGQAVADRFGVAGFRARYDARGNQVLLLRLGAGGRPVESTQDGISILVTQYDERDRVAATFFFDAQGKPRANPDGGYGLAYRYDPRGRVIESRNLGPDGGLKPNSNGAARWESVYDAAGGLSETRFFDASGAPASANQAPVVRRRNDEHGLELERTFFDGQGHQIVSPSSGRWRVLLERDAFGRLVSEQSQGPAGQAVNRIDTGWSSRTLSYGDMGQLVEVRCFDREGARVNRCEQAE